MQALHLRGTPSLLLLGKQGRIRLQEFGRTDDLWIGAEIGRLLAEGPGGHANAECDANGCLLPTARPDHERRQVALTHSLASQPKAVKPVKAMVCHRC